MACPNRRGLRDYGEDLGECGDEGRLCEECEDKREAEMLATYGLPPAGFGRTQEQIDQDLRDAGRGHLVGDRS